MADLNDEDSASSSDWAAATLQFAALWQQWLASHSDPEAAGAVAPFLEAVANLFARLADEPGLGDREQGPALAALREAWRDFAGKLAVAAEAGLEGSDAAQRERGRFASRLLLETLDPDHFALTNPKVIARARETRGNSLVKGMANLLADMARGQQTHTDPRAFCVGENIALTPGKVIHETRLYQLIQYTPVTPRVLAMPVVIFPPWINRFYILDLKPAKSFVRWAVEQGLSLFMVSWKSADASLADVVWDDYVNAQIEAIDLVRARLKVPSVHALGYCVAGTTLAATLAVLARRGAADRVASATFLTTQVDFSEAGDLGHFISDQGGEAIDLIATDGVVDGRWMAAVFNLLRPRELIWNYAVRHYLMGEDYPAFDLLHWNGDVTNLPARWHKQFLGDLYRDNRLVEPDALSIDGTPVDLRRIAQPSYIQAGREDHIAPAASVWKMTQHLGGDSTFMLAGSGHIAGVVNPPASGKYQHWTCNGATESYDEFVAVAKEQPGSWWPHWLGWLRALHPGEVAARGKRVPGRKGDPVIEDAPGRYVRMR